MDIKNSPEKYAETCGLSQMDLAPVRESVSLLMEGRTDYEFRTTTMAELHDADSFRKIGEWIRGAKRYYLQKFTDRDTVPFEGFHAPADGEMAQYLAIAREYVPEAEIRG
jgi:pyruvate formate lyase activating enzyme